jgi:hypothetical protein
MICIKAEIPEELNKIDDELRNEFVERTKGMNKEDREKVYEMYKSK